MDAQEAFARARRCHQAGDLLQAEQLYRDIVRVDPGNAQAWYLRGVACLSLGKLDDAVTSLQQAVTVRPTFAEAFNHLGLALIHQGRTAEAAANFQQAIRLMPQLAEAHSNLGLALAELGNLDEATASFRAALALRPASPEMHLALGRALIAQWKLDEAAASLHNAVRLRPSWAEAHAALALVLLRQGRAEEAAESYRSAVQADPTNAAAHSALLLSLHYGPRVEVAGLFAEHLRWAKQHAAVLAPARRIEPKSHAGNRLLRIGYVSADFREHPVAYVIGPILEAHDRRRYHVTAYADVPLPDAVTARLQGYADKWRSIAGMTDEAVAQLVRADQIDILVDVTGHAGKHRLLMFARAPAPVQATYFGYPNTTGLSVMDYRVTDAHADPPGTTEMYHTEKLVRLPEVAWCYRPSSNVEVGPLPALAAGHITFASFNNIPKVTPDVIAVWARILFAVPDARLKLLTNSSGPGNQRISDSFARRGVSSDRITFVDRLPRERYLELHNTADICLDPFPYNGGVTTCDALWMGVPVVSLAGNAYVSRQGVSMLSNLGLCHLLAPTPEAYVAIAVRLAGDVKELSELRDGLRAKMAASPLMNVGRFVSGLENAYDGMWRSE